MTIVLTQANNDNGTKPIAVPIPLKTWDEGLRTIYIIAIATSIAAKMVASLKEAKYSLAGKLKLPGDILCLRATDDGKLVSGGDSGYCCYTYSLCTDLQKGPMVLKFGT